MLRDITAQTIQINTESPPCIRNNNKNSKSKKKLAKRVKFDANGTRSASEITDEQQWRGKGFRKDGSLKNLEHQVNQKSQRNL
jgi:hypothetical protein